MADISIRGVSKVFPNGVVAVRDVHLEVADGEFLVLVGPSGCGKSTLLRMIAGLEEVTAGALLVDGRDITDAQPRERDIAMVFQSYALYPHMTVRKNIGYPLKIAGLPAHEIDTARRRRGTHAAIGGRTRSQARAALGWTTSASGDGPSDRSQTVSVPDGRTAVEPRRQVAGADARRDLPAATRVPHDHRVRHARPDRSDDDG